MEILDRQGTSLSQWGKTVLEEVLFRAGRRLTDPDETPALVEVGIDFQIVAGADSPALEITYQSVDSTTQSIMVRLD
ncbi:MAG: hypothetical protein F4X36_06730 [Gammaproteobacteria bacterium]|nr:hypothetical protein [Gammaproteobacteria bacterium]